MSANNGDVLIPSILTTSLLEVLSRHHSRVEAFTAKGSTEETVQSGSFLPKLGGEKTVTEQTEVPFDYKLERDNHRRPVNEIQDMDVQRLKQELQSEMGGYTDPKTGKQFQSDLPLSSLTLLVKSEALKETIESKSERFLLDFASDPADAAMRERTRELNEDYGRYRMGFKVRQMNLRRVMTGRQKFFEDDPAPYFSWGGPGDTQPNRNDDIAKYVRNKVLSKKYGTLKRYRVGQDDTLELVGFT